MPVCLPTFGDHDRKEAYKAGRLKKHSVRRGFLKEDRQKGRSMVTVYCYNRCSTCKKALKWLDEREIKYELKDIKTEHPDRESLKKYYELSGLPLKRFFNTSGIPYREMGLSAKLKEMSDEDQLSLLATDGMLVKRPLVVGKDFVLTGFKEGEWEEKLS